MSFITIALIMIYIFTTTKFFIWPIRLKQKEEKRDIYTEMYNMLEDERKRISRELHDNLGQNLLLIKNLVNLVCSETSIPENKKLILFALLDDSITEVRNISR